jgi:hypothetical protein
MTKREWIKHRNAERGDAMMAASIARLCAEHAAGANATGGDFRRTQTRGRLWRRPAFV